MRITTARRTKPRSATPQLAEAEQRRDPVVRRRLSEPALRTFFAIARAWGLSATEERALLGWPPSSTFHKYKSGNGRRPFLRHADTRISLVLGIYKALEVLYSGHRVRGLVDERAERQSDVRGPDSCRLRIEAGLDGLYQVLAAARRAQG